MNLINKINKILNEKEGKRGGELWLLIGIIDDVYQDKIGGDFESHLSEFDIALFTSKKKAEDYVKKQKLRKPIRDAFDSEKIFNQKGPLAPYSDYEIKLYQKAKLPIIE